MDSTRSIQPKPLRENQWSFYLQDQEEIPYYFSEVADDRVIHISALDNEPRLRNVNVKYFDCERKGDGIDYKGFFSTGGSVEVFFSESSIAGSTSFSSLELFSEIKQIHFYNKDVQVLNANDILHIHHPKLDNSFKIVALYKLPESRGFEKDVLSSRFIPLEAATSCQKDMGRSGFETLVKQEIKKERSGSFISRLKSSFSGEIEKSRRHSECSLSTDMKQDFSGRAESYSDDEGHDVMPVLSSRQKTISAPELDGTSFAGKQVPRIEEVNDSGQRRKKSGSKIVHAMNKTTSGEEMVNDSEKVEDAKRGGLMAMLSPRGRKKQPGQVIMRSQTEDILPKFNKKN